MVVCGAGFSLEGHPMTRFNGGENGEGEKKHVGDDYFLGSNDKIRFFFEEGTPILPSQYPPSITTNISLSQTPSIPPAP